MSDLNYSERIIGQQDNKIAALEANVKQAEYAAKEAHEVCLSWMEKARKWEKFKNAKEVHAEMARMEARIIELERLRRLEIEAKSGYARELFEAKNYAAEIAQGISHYPHGHGDPCMRCERDTACLRIKELEAITQGRTVSCVCGGEGKISDLEDRLAMKDRMYASAVAAYNRKEEWSNSADKVVVAARALDAAYRDDGAWRSLWGDLSAAIIWHDDRDHRGESTDKVKGRKK